MATTNMKDINTMFDLRPHYGSGQSYYDTNPVSGGNKSYDSGYSSEEDKPWYKKLKYTGNLTDDERIEEEAIQHQIELSNIYYEKVRNGEIDPLDYINLSDTEEEYKSDTESDYIPPEDYDEWDDLDNQYWSEHEDDYYYQPQYDDDGNEIIDEDFYGDDENEEDEIHGLVKPSRQWGYM